MKTNPNGLVLFETADVVCIATGCKASSANAKTGGMIQVWFLYKHCNPVEAQRRGLDKSVCFNCKHRNGTCYVNLGQAPLAVWNCWNRGGYAQWDGDTSIFEGRIVRFGAYGEPVLMPYHMMKRIADAAAGWTGYTHLWKRYMARRRWRMASVDCPTEAAQARQRGWRTFRVTQTPSPMVNEITCPSSAEAGNKVTCERCLLCAGTSKPTKDIAIAVHGSGKNNFNN